VRLSGAAGHDILHFSRGSLSPSGIQIRGPAAGGYRSSPSEPLLSPPLPPPPPLAYNGLPTFLQVNSGAVTPVERMYDLTAWKAGGESLLRAYRPGGAALRQRAVGALAPRPSASRRGW